MQKFLQGITKFVTKCSDLIDLLVKAVKTRSKPAISLTPRTAISADLFNFLSYATYRFVVQVCKLLTNGMINPRKF